ncbi:MAG TPA: phosphoribosylaminoimidazolesuccinocarboxamide synthase [Chromatiales bacterium]|nr:phosphoribosylaminoimidazolesuccinocarboxamide synthase [Thiotrichales bacterium]HIP67066.1 phosphoribosylaminoimidazolesuccinocarboxamide synthase [Chromatiales bacterium]
MIYDTQIHSLKLKYKGKVRDIYEVDNQHMLIVTTDRISAFDVILPTPIPQKGEVLTQISNFWFNKFNGLIPNHLSDIKLENILPDPLERKPIETRSVIVKKLKALPVEAIVRGYLIGSGWKDYQQTGAVCGINLPPGLQLADKLPEAIYTPSTKADIGDHDLNISFEKTVELIGKELAEQVRDISLKIYQQAAELALKRGIIIADTKFEFGLDENGKLHLIDEALTPDSSRFWPAATYKPGISPPSFDKQFVRDYLETLDWDKTAPGPELPENIVRQTAEKYQEALSILTN